MRFLKGHGTENDFVILPDAPDLTPAQVALLCDRRAGIGADGVLRAVRAEGRWFMDYRNADGGIAEMCGNGVRVFARYLVDTGLAEPGTFEIGTRAGVKTVTLGASGDVSVDMGAPEVLGRGSATVGGTAYDGWRISMGNPHLACPIGSPVAALDLTAAPAVDPALFPEGVNVEFYEPAGGHRVAMRVHERGSGETRSCGTGAVATAVAAALEAGEETGEWAVDVLGGRVVVTLDGRTSHLRGPAVLVADGEIRDLL